MPNTPYTTTGANGPFSTLENLIRSALRDMGETSPDTLISQMGPRLIASANRIVDEVNRHPTLLDLLDDDKQFDNVSGSITSGTTTLTLASMPQNLNLYAPVRIEGAGYGGGPLISFVLGFPGTNQVRIADEAITTVASAAVRPVYRSRIARYVTNADIRFIDDLVMIEGIKFYWGIDETSMITPTAAQKLSARYYQTLNSWLASLASYQSVLETDARQDRLDY